MSPPLPAPEPGRQAAEEFVGRHLHGLYCDEVSGSDAFSGGQGAADDRLANFSVAGYAATRNEVWPAPRRGASALSPYIRHGLLSLPQVWSHVQGGPRRDVQKFRDELLWQEYARHWYARLGRDTGTALRHELPVSSEPPFPMDGMACLETCTEELEDDGWLVNQSRMWMASHHSVRLGRHWRDGEDDFFRHLLDGSRAANRLGWQWTTGAGSAKVYGFSRWQVEKRAPGLCGQCERSGNCPIEHWPDDPDLIKIEPNPKIRRSPDPTAESGPGSVMRLETPDVVWLTAESLAATEPALAANPTLPAIFVFDEPLLQRLQLSSKRLVFLVETLAELGTSRTVVLHRGRPAEVLADHRPAVTFAPVPGFAKISTELAFGEIHPFPWLSPPKGGSVASFSAWRKSVKR